MIKAATAISALPFNPPDNINNNIYNKGGLPIADVNNYPYNNAVTDKEKEKFSKGLCYLCGSQLSKVSLNSPFGHKDIECEHIIPIKDMCLLILAFTDVAMKQEFNQHNATLQYLMKLSYLWSHSVCNQVKTNILFIKPPISGENQSFEINNEVIGDYLKNLSGIIKEKQIDLVDDSNQVIKQHNDWGNVCKRR